MREGENLMNDTRRKIAACAIVWILILATGGRWSTFGQSDDKLAAARKLYQEANELFDKNSPESLEAAKAKYKDASRLFRAAGDKQGEADSLYSIALILDDAGERSAAMENYRQALTLYQAVANKDWEAQTLIRIGMLQSSAKEYQLAADSDRQALQLYRQLKDRSGEAAALVNLGVDYTDLNDKQQALDRYQQALTIYRELGSKTKEADTLASMADVYSDLDKAPEALNYYGNALMLYRELGNKSKEAETLNEIGEISVLFGEKQKALDLFQEALRIYVSIGDKNGEAETLGLIGSTYSALILPEKALSYLERALKIYRETGDSKAEAAILIGLSGLYANLGEKEKALDYSNQASVIIRRDSSKEADVFAPLLSPATLGASLSLATLGASDNEEEAKAKLKEAFSHFDRQPSRLKGEEAVDYIVRMMMVGFYHFISEENQKALEYWDRGLEAARSENQKMLEVMMLIYVGLAQGESKPQIAINNLHQAYDIAHSLGNKSYEALITLFVGLMYGELYEKEKRAEYLTQTLNYLNQALVLYRTTNDINVEAYLLQMLMEIWEKENNPPLAILYGKQAVNLFQGVRSELRELDRKLQDSYLLRVVETYQKLANILIAQGRIAEAEQVLAMLKEEEFFEYLRRDDKVAKELLGKLSLTPAEQEAFKRYEAIADTLTRIGRELGELQVESQRFPAGKFPRQARLDDLEKQLADANQVFNAFLDELKIKFGENDRRVAEVESGTQALLKELNQPRTVVISTIAGEDRLNLIVTTSDAQRAHTVDIKAADLNRLVYEFREAVKNPKVDPRPVGKRLYDVLFPAALQKDLEGVKADTIIWSLDGTLRYAPIAALWDGEKYLVEHYAISVITLASRGNLNQAPTDRTKWQALGLGVSKPFQTFSALPAVPGELCRVVNDPQAAARCKESETGVVAGRSLLDDEFTLSTFKAHLGRYPVIHIASHFSLNAGNETDSFLLLGGGKTDEERRLTLASVRAELKTGFVGVELLTLSACNTAMTAGARSNGLEVEGFGALAQKQGAKAVLATLWAVADPSTRDLMAEFYRILETDKGIGKAEALRRAQLTLLNGTYKVEEIPLWRRGAEIVDMRKDLPSFKEDPNAPFAHPYFWSPFVLFGNWR